MLVVKKAMLTSSVAYVSATLQVSVACVSAMLTCSIVDVSAMLNFSTVYVLATLTLAPVWHPPGDSPGCTPRVRVVRMRQRYPPDPVGGLGGRIIRLYQALTGCF